MDCIKATILDGKRAGTEFILSLLTSNTSQALQWVKENEAIKFEVILSNYYSEVLLQLYDHILEPNYSTVVNAEYNKYVWIPQKKSCYYQSMFFNYFGIAELSISSVDNLGNKEYYKFEPLDVLASKAKASSINSMILYLSCLGEEKLHSLIQTTKFGAGYQDGSNVPTSYLERLEDTVEIISKQIDLILKKPISKLTSVTQMIYPTGMEILDESSIAWLIDNLSVLETIGDEYNSHFTYEDHPYRARLLQVSSLKEQTYVYENEVVHATVLYLLIRTKEQLLKYKDISQPTSYQYSVPSGYVSFYTQVQIFEKRLLGNQLNRCLALIEKLGIIKHKLEQKLPVKKVSMNRPMLTAKAASNKAYRKIFYEYILWLECPKPDWSLYNNLMAITSVPRLFELYSVFRVEDVLRKLFVSSGNKFITGDGEEIKMIYEPKYWMSENKKSFSCDVINSEGMRIDKDKEIKERSHHSKYSHRCPDIVIEIKKKNELPHLIVLDAKYTSEMKAMTSYLPECTMKYVHGLSYRSNNKRAVDSMTIIYPHENGKINSFHSQEYSLYGNKAVLPALQCLGICLGEGRDNDPVLLTIKQLLKLSGIRKMG